MADPSNIEIDIDSVIDRLLEGTGLSSLPYRRWRSGKARRVCVVMFSRSLELVADDTSPRVAVRACAHELLVGWLLTESLQALLRGDCRFLLPVASTFHPLIRRRCCCFLWRCSVGRPCPYLYHFTNVLHL